MGHGDCLSCELNRKYSCALLVVHRGEKLMRRLQWCRGSWPKRHNNATDRYRRRLHGAKAEILSILVKDSSPVFGTNDPYREVGAEAALKILETVTSHREFIEVLKRMGKDGVKGDFNDLRTNYAILMFQRLFKSQQSAKTEEWLRNLYG